MILMFPNYLLLMLMASLVLSGCTPRLDLAPVITDEQRNSQYRLATVIPGPNMGEDKQVTSANESRVVDKHNSDGNHSGFLADNKQKNNLENGPLKAEFIDNQKKQEKILSPVADAGLGDEKSARENSVALPSGIATENTITLSNSYSEEQAIYKKDKTNQKAADDYDKSKTDGLGKTKTKIEKQTISKSSKTDYNPEKKKKKSIVSIDNKNILMLNFQWPLKGKIRKQFNQTEQKGIDISGRTGQTVRASESGKVVYRGQGLIGFGNLLIIKHNNEFLSAYANNGDIFVKEGQRVNKGQGIAKLGVAVSKNVILHFEIRKNGKPVDPLSLLP